MDDRSIRRLYLWGLPIFLSLVLGLSIFNYRYVSGVILHRFNERQSLIALRMSEHLRDHLFGLADNMEREACDLFQDSTVPMQTQLKKIYDDLRHKPLEVCFADETGAIRNVHPAGGDRFGIDIGGQPAFREARRSGLPRIGALDRTSSGIFVFDITVPVIIKSTFRGAICCRFLLEPVMEQFAAPLKSEYAGVSWIIDQNGSLIFSPDPREIGFKLGSRLAAEGRSDEASVLSAILAGQGGTRVARSPGRGQVHIAYQPVGLGRDGNAGYWGLALMVPQARILAGMRWPILSLGALFAIAAAYAVGTTNLHLKRQRELMLGLKEKNDSLRRLSQAVGAIREAVIISDPEGRVVFANSAAEKVLEKSPGDIEGANIRDLFPDLSALSPGGDIIARTITGGYSGEIWLTSASGLKSPIFLSSSAILDEKGSAHLALFIVQDIKDLKKAEEEVNSRRLELESHLYTLSHDLKSPLATIKGYADVLLSKIAEGIPKAEEHECLDRIRKATIRMNVLIEQIMELSRLGLTLDQSQKIPFGKIVEIVRASQASPMQAAGIRFAAQRDFPEVYADPERLAQVLDNIVGNAVKFARRDGEIPFIEIGWEEGEREHLFRVRDNGRGIEPRFHQKIFEPFFRVEGRDECGSGIGLAIVKRIIEQHGGRVWVESAMGAGSTFFFTLPKFPPPRLVSGSAA